MATARANEPAAIDKLRRIILPPTCNHSFRSVPKEARTWVPPSEPRGHGARANPALCSTLRLQIREQLLDAVFLFERGQPVVEVVSSDF
jgi:hypothetical protein